MPQLRKPLARGSRPLLPCTTSTGAEVASRDSSPACRASPDGRGASRAQPLPARAASSSSAWPSWLNTWGRRLLFLLAFAYFQLSTFTLVQWVKQHAPPSDRYLGQGRHDAELGNLPHRGAGLSPASLLVADASWPPPPPVSVGHATSAAARLGAREAADGPGRMSTLGTKRTLVADDPDDYPVGEGSRASGVAKGTDVETEDEASLLQEGLAALEDHTLGALSDIRTPVDGSVGDATAAPAKVAGWLESDAYGKFIGISTFFNPGRHLNKVENFRKFRTSVQAQGLQLLCVELTFGIAPAQLDANDCDILLHRNTSEGNTLWQKERLLNIAVENLPHSVEKVMWLDTDLIFLNDDWVPETAELLDRYSVVQPFGWMTYLPASAGADGAAYIPKLSTLPLGMGVGAVYHSAGLGVSAFGDMAFRSNFLLGHPGFAWAARREVITAAGFYDRSIVGGGDRIMLNAFTGHHGGVRKKFSREMARRVIEHGRSISPLVGAANISYTPGIVLHIWHGDLADRDYRNRYQILLTNEYDPQEDVRVGADGLLEWSSDKPRLHRQLAEYFDHRKEGPRPDRTAPLEGSTIQEADEQEDGFDVAKRASSRALQSYAGYHCRKADYRQACKTAFRLWGETLQFTLIQARQKQLREMQEEQKALQEEQRRRSDAEKAAPAMKSKPRKKRGRHGVL